MIGYIIFFAVWVIGAVIAYITVFSKMEKDYPSKKEQMFVSLFWPLQLCVWPMVGLKELYLKLIHKK